MKQWLSAVALAGFVGSAWGWEYQVVADGAIIYQDQQPPAGISYPPAGERSSARMLGEQIEGRVISEAELRQNLSRPHLVIIPDQPNQPTTFDR